MLITLIVGLIILAYFMFRAIRIGELKKVEFSIMAIFSIAFTGYFIYFITVGV
jgi:hypothetical protein